MSRNEFLVILEFAGFAALTIALNLAARARRRRNAARWYPHNDQINPWTPTQGDQHQRHGHHGGSGGGHHHGGWSGGGDGGHHGGWSGGGGDGGSPGGHHG